MRISCFSTFHKNSGSGLAALNFSKILKSINPDTTLYVSDIDEDNNHHFVKKIKTSRFNSSNFIDSLYLRITRLRKINEFFSLGLISTSDKQKFKEIVNNSDIIFIFWINNGFLSLRDISYCLNCNKKIYWRLSDEWPFTNGFHYDNDNKLKKLNKFQKLLLLINKKIKFNIINNKKLCFISPSKWIFDKYNIINNSNKSRIIHIPTSINISVFKPFNSDFLKSKSKNKNYKRILFGAQNCIEDQRKGFDMLIDVTKYLKDKRFNNYEFFIFGCNKFKSLSINGFNFITLGKVKCAKTLAEIYNDSHLFVSLSRFENLANTMLEATHCGIPILSFNIGGASEIIVPNINGQLVAPFKIDEFALSLVKISNLPSNKIEISNLALSKFSPEIVSSKLKYHLNA